ncbi:MAG: alpha/beta hydrolase [Chloroflexi bacterium]|nr:alpha/beta hydrolase [Chloroflexota bacterium]MCC6896708.1 alpha/beta hydrolase [Anaerolineae bacterium]
MILYDHATIKTNGVNLHVVQAGPPDGQLVILLHGFPEFWYGWRKQIDFLAEQGYRVWVPDQRGYNISDKPKGIAAYKLNELAKDVIGLIDAAGCDTALLVGHDWGAGVAWWTACSYPERLSKLVILNVPHLRVFRQTVTTDWTQMKKSWYMGYFQIPFLPEALFERMIPQMARGIQESAKPGAFTDEDMQAYQSAWAQPGALRSMINWYRAAVQQMPTPEPGPTVKVPTLILWGKKDFALNAEMAQESLKFCEDGRLIYFENATHWLQHDEPEQVNEALKSFFSETS